MHSRKTQSKCRCRGRSTQRTRRPVSSDSRRRTAWTCTRPCWRRCSHPSGSRLSWKDGRAERLNPCTADGAAELRRFSPPGAVREGDLVVCVHPLVGEPRRKAVPLIKGHAGAQRVGARRTLPAPLRLHVQKLPLVTGEC